MSISRKVFISAISAASCLVTLASALADESRSELGEVVVTATRTPEPIENVIGSVTVITREQIEKRQLLSVQDLLREETGLDLTSQGGLGKLTALYMRGTEPEHMLVLVDGVRIGSVTAGNTPFEYLPLDQIERIEIVRGPRSSLYGSDAVGGVIQIFTRRGGRGISFNAGTGSRYTNKIGASYRNTWNDVWLSVSGSQLSSEGYNACKGSLTTACFTVEPDNDGYQSRSGSVRAGVKIDDVFDADVGAVYSSGRNEFDGSFTNQTDFREFIPSLHAHLKPIDALDVSLNAGINRDDQTQRHDEQYRSFFNTERQNASLQTDLKLTAAQTATLGVDYLNDKVASDTAFNVDARDNIGVFGEYQLGIGSQRINASARYDDNEQFGGHTTGNLGWKWNVLKSLDVHAGWGTAFRAPSFNDLYYPGFSNPNLNPEESRSIELGVKGHITDWVWSATVYQNNIDELIELDSSFSPANVAQARIRGFEWSDTYTFSAFALTTSYSYTDPRNRVSGPTYNNVLMRRARHSGLARLTFSDNTVDLSLVGRIQGRRFNNAGNTSSLGGYVTFDLLGEYALNREFKLQGKITNALDRDYETVYLYNETPRTFFVGLQYTPEFLK